MAPYIGIIQQPLKNIVDLDSSLLSLLCGCQLQPQTLCIHNAQKFESKT